ncbi:MAG: hypothetical protein CMJ46_14465 [Planctomyces sp.]|nr:hypothetical protein [Planctomyces sp.]
MSDRQRNATLDFGKLVLASMVVGAPLLYLESHYNLTAEVRPETADLLIGLFLLCPAIFMLLMKHPLMNRVSTLSLYANGIYFIHVFFLMLFKSRSLRSDTPDGHADHRLGNRTFFLIQLNKKIPYIL